MACAACFSGAIRNDAEPTGKIEQIHGLKTYVAQPPDGKTAKGAIVIVPDAFGIDLKNNKLLADAYARLGPFQVYLPDFMDGHAAPLWLLDILDSVTKDTSLWGWVTMPYNIAWGMYGFLPFIYWNTLDVSMPRVTNFLASLRQDDATSKLPVGVAGFCWGGQHITRLCWDNPEPSPETDPPAGSLIQAAFTAHPSQLKVPADIEKVKKPLCIATGDLDKMTPVKQIREAEEVLKRNGVKHKIKVYEGADHGWSVRIDRRNPKQKEQAEDCEQLAVDWFLEHFKSV